MLLRFYKSYNTLALISVPFIIAGIWSYSFFYEPHPNLHYSLPFMNDLFGSINKNALLSYVFSVVFISVGSFFVNSIFNKYQYFDKFIFLPALIYALGMSSNKELFYFSPVIISNLFVLLAFSQLLKINRNESAKSQAFNFGLLIGISSIFHITNILLFPAIFIVLSGLNSFNIKEILLSIIGLFVPLIYILVYAEFFANENFSDYYRDVQLIIDYKVDWTAYELIYYSAVLIISFIALFMLVPRYSKAGLRYKRIINVFLIFSFMILIWTLFNFFFLKESNFTAFLTIPLTFLLTFYLVYVKNQTLASIVFNLGIISLCLMIFL